MERELENEEEIQKSQALRLNLTRAPAEDLPVGFLSFQSLAKLVPPLQHQLP